MTKTDFVKIVKKFVKGQLYIGPEFVVRPRLKDLMVRGKSFYAVWDEQNNIWSTDECRVADMIDEAIANEVEKYSNSETPCTGLYLSNFSSNKWTEWQKYVKSLPDNYHKLNAKIIFSNDDLKKTDYASFSLPYNIAKGELYNYDQLMSTLYSEDNRQKIEWAIGSIINGASKKLQKFLVLYGDAGTGKSTVLNIIQMLFDGYWVPFNAKELTASNNSFALEQFKTDPLVAIQHDGDLSRIEDNTLLNSLVSHETMTINEKFKSKYKAKFETFLFMASNSPVRITNTKSGLLRRLIDVYPTGEKLSRSEYNKIFKGVKSELGAIAHYCLTVFEELGPSYYDAYRPKEMFEETNDFYNFMFEMKEIFCQGTSLKAAWSAYKDYVDEAKINYPFNKRVFKTELKGYFLNHYDQKRMPDGTNVTNYYDGFIFEKFEGFSPPKLVENIKTVVDIPGWLNLTEGHSLFDDICHDCMAQYANDEESPMHKWDKVKTTLSDIDTSKLHFVRIPENHIVIDFDLKDKDGNKNLSANIEAAAKYGFYPTYAEASKSGQGLHLHYIYDGDVELLSPVFAPGIEVKVYRGLASLRRKRTICNDLDICHISGGLPYKEKKKMINDFRLKNEKMLRAMVVKNLNKGYHNATKPSIDYIYYLLTQAHDSGMKYNLTDLKPNVLYFASNSTNNSKYCIEMFTKMPFSSDEDEIDKEVDSPKMANDDKFKMVFFDVEVFSNVFIVCWKYEKEDIVYRWINPTREQIEELMSLPLVGFNNRKYDNHILYAWLLGYDNESLYSLSKRIISGSPNSTIADAYNISYTDVYDFCSKKQSLKKWEIELGINHQENAYPWDEPLDETHWAEVADYCANDVRATEAVFYNRVADFKARLILSVLSGLTPNASTRMHATKIIFGNEKHPKLNYTDLSEMFPGYEFKNGHSMYRGEDPKEGGYVYAEPGIYQNVALLDIASMHPTSIEQLNLFGDYTKRFSEIKQARIFIKHKDYESAKKILDGKLAIFLTDETEAKDLSQALKIVINSIYGYTSAKFTNPFKDERNVDNIVAKRGALFMINLKHEVQDRGFTVAHIKTDSIKIPNATPEIIQFVYDYGKQYGYIFEHEDTYEKMCLVNDAVYVAKSEDGHWSATGTQFQVPYVFKTLFSHEDIEFKDMCETKSVTTAMYLDFNETLPEDEHEYVFVGRVGLFTPVKSGTGGGELLREKDGKYSAVVGTKGYRWKESSMVESRLDEIDISYYKSLVDDALASIDEQASKSNMSTEEFIN